MTESTLLNEFSAISAGKRHAQNKQIAAAILTKINGKALTELLQQQNREEIIHAALSRAGLSYEDSDPEALFAWLGRYGITIELLEAEEEIEWEYYTEDDHERSYRLISPAALIAHHPDGHEIVTEAEDTHGLVELIFNEWLF